MSLCRSLLLRLRAADVAELMDDPRLHAGGAVFAADPVVPLPFFPAAVCAGFAVLLRAVLKAVFPGMLRQGAGEGAAVEAPDAAGAVAVVPRLGVLMGAALRDPAAAADELRGPIALRHRFKAVLHLKPAVQPGDAVSHGVAVAILPAAHIPAVGQRVAQRERLPVLQGIFRHTGAGIEGIVKTVEPAGAAGEILIAHGHGIVARQGDAVAVNAAPQRGISAACAEIAVDGRKDLLLAAAKAVEAVGLQRFGPGADAGAVAHGAQIKAHIQRSGVIAIGAVPAEGLFRGAEGRSGVVAPDGLCHRIGDRLVGQHIVAHRAVNAQTQDGHVDIDLRRADGLALRGALADERDGQLALVSVFIPGIDGEHMGVLVALRRIVCIQLILLHKAGSARVKQLLAVQLHRHLRAGAGGADMADNAAVVLLAPGLHGQIHIRLVFDLLPILQVRFYDHRLFAPGKIGDIDREAVFPALDV